MGDPKRQLTHHQWYVTKRRSSAILFPVRGLKSAIEAALEIVYEGEGGSPCTPFMTTPAQTRDLYTTLAAQQSEDPFATQMSPDFEKSHWVKFLELAHGREVVPVRGTPPHWSDVECLPVNRDVCGCYEANSTSCWRFCFTGKTISFKEGTDNVWPVYHLPFMPPAVLNMPTKKLNTKTALLRAQFNVQYTNLLHCLGWYLIFPNNIVLMLLA